MWRAPLFPKRRKTPIKILWCSTNFRFLSCIFLWTERLWTSTSTQPRWNFAFRNNRQCMMPCLRQSTADFWIRNWFLRLRCRSQNSRKKRKSRVQVRFYSNRSRAPDRAQRLFPDQFPCRILTAPLRKIRLIQGYIHLYNPRCNPPQKQNRKQKMRIILSGRCGNVSCLTTIAVHRRRSQGKVRFSVLEIKDRKIGSKMPSKKRRLFCKRLLLCKGRSLPRCRHRRSS